MTTLKTKNGILTGFVPGVGAIVDGKIEVPDGMQIENANLEKVEVVSPPLSEAPIAPAAPVASQPTVTAPQPTPSPLPTPPANEQTINKETE